MSQSNAQDLKQNIYYYILNNIYLSIYLFVYVCLYAFYVFMHAFGVKLHLDIFLIRFIKIKWYLKTRGMTMNI